MKNFIGKLFGAGASDLRNSAMTGNFSAVGFPKVGNTWLRITIGRYLQLRYKLAEMPLMDQGEFQALADAGCHAIGSFTHFPLEWQAQTADDLNYENVVAPFEGARVLFLVRHPLDSLVSLYMQMRHKVVDAPFNGSIEEFIAHPVFGLEKLLKFYAVWDEGRQRVGAFHLWRYEDARNDPFTSLLSALEFLGEEVDSKLLHEAVEFASFDNLKALEASNSTDLVYKSSGFSIFGTAPTNDDNARHVRKGEVGGYRREIPESIVLGLEQRVRAEMPEYFGYS